MVTMQTYSIPINVKFLYYVTKLPLSLIVANKNFLENVLSPVISHKVHESWKQLIEGVFLIIEPTQ